MKNYLLAFALIFCIGIPSQAQSDSIRSFRLVGMSGYTVEQYDKFEMILQLDADFENPYDPDDIRMDATFISPSGSEIVVPAFYYRDFEYTLDEAGQNMQWIEAFTWRVRFTPTEVGDWRFTVTAQTANAEETTPEQMFVAVDSGRPGFVRVSPTSTDYLAFDDGSFYFPVGLNMAWYSDRRMANYRAWLDAFKASGGNTIRVWLVNFGFGFEWLDTGLGNYDGRQDRMYELDRLVEMLAERDMYMMLTLLTHPEFSLEVDSQWADNPYNVANGGILELPREFATHPEAQRLWRMKLRYIVARWGYSPNIMAWEWWNEVNWTELANPDTLIPWLRDNGDYLRELDPNDHLITHSGSPVDSTRIWSIPTLDIVQDHLYEIEDWTDTLVSLLREWQLTYDDKPFLLGEYGYVDPPELDPLGIRLHNGLWTAPMSGALGTGMFWWWDSYVHEGNHYQHYTGISAFFADEDLTEDDWLMTSARVSQNASIQGIQSPDTLLLRVINRDYNDVYYREQYAQVGEAVTFPTIDNARVTLAWMTAGTYEIEWWDTLSGTIIAEETTDTTGTLILDVPPFDTDIAVKIKLVGG